MNTSCLMLKTEQNKTPQNPEDTGMLLMPKHRKHTRTRAGSYTFWSTATIMVSVLTQANDS